MIEFKDPEHFLTVLKFAAANNCAAKLADKLEYLAQYGNGDNRCDIGRDYAAHSFSFAMYQPDGRFWFNGGLIYSGPGQPLDGSAPAFTVSLERTGHEHNWSIHT